MDTATKNKFLGRKKHLELLMSEHAVKVVSNSENIDLFSQFRMSAIHLEHTLLLDFANDHGFKL